MLVSRRKFTQFSITAGLLGVASLIDTVRAQSAAYTYDPLGRLTRVVNADGSTIDYAYDAAGNRTSVVRSGAPPAQFTATIAVPGGGPVSLRTLANAAGYDGARNATVTFTLAAGAIITGAANGGIGIDSGDWPFTNYAVALTLQISGLARGGGGIGGNGAGVAHGQPGGVGGDAVYCRAPMSIVVNAGGQLVAGGGGGGGGGGRLRTIDPPFDRVGGGGGGGYPNGAGGTFGFPSQDGISTGAANGAPGVISGGGAGGGGETGGGGAGGAAGGQAASGTSGIAGSGAGTAKNAGAGGAPGYAVRKNGNAVSITNNGSIVGAQA